MPLRCQCGIPTISSRAYDHFCGPNDYLNHDQRVVPVWGPCDQPAMYLRVTVLRFLKFCHSGELNKIVKATTMPVNPYDDDWVSLQWPNVKDDLDVVRAS